MSPRPGRRSCRSNRCPRSTGQPCPRNGPSNGCAGQQRLRCPPLSRAKMAEPGRLRVGRGGVPTGGLRSQQTGAAPGTRTRLMPHHRVRIGDLRQRRSRMPRLPSRLAAAVAPQRLRRRLHERRVRRRRHRRVLAVLRQLPPQLSDLGPQHLDHRPKLRVLRGNVLIGRTSVGGHHTIINNSLPRSTNHADGLTSYHAVALVRARVERGRVWLIMATYSPVPARSVGSTAR